MIEALLLLAISLPTKWLMDRRAARQATRRRMERYIRSGR